MTYNLSLWHRVKMFRLNEKICCGIIENLTEGNRQAGVLIYSSLTS
jgi:hypothetical protein